MLGAVTVKAENPQVDHLNKITYPLYLLLRLTEIFVSHKRYTEHRVQAVQKLIRFDKRAPEGG